jgi:hypothetical protein
MDLKQFVSETLTQIVAGIEDAQAKVKAMNNNAKINPHFGSWNTTHGSEAPVEFDVALVISDEHASGSTDTAKGSVGFLSVVSAKLSGEMQSQESGKQRSETVSRVKFSVQLAQPADIKIV